MEDKYNFNEEDFSEEPFHQILFGAIYNLHHLGAKEINENTIKSNEIICPKCYEICLMEINLCLNLLCPKEKY